MDPLADAWRTGGPPLVAVLVLVAAVGHLYRAQVRLYERLLDQRQRRGRGKGDGDGRR